MKSVKYTNLDHTITGFKFISRPVKLQLQGVVTSTSMTDALCSVPITNAHMHMHMHQLTLTLNHFSISGQIHVSLTCSHNVN